VDSSGAEKRSAYEKDINPPFTLLTNTYGICRVRVWESVGEAQYFIFVIYTDATNTQSGWRNCTDAPEEYEMALAAGKTVDIIRLYIRAADLASTVTVQWDYVMVISATPWVHRHHGGRCGESKPRTILQAQGTIPRSHRH
jgi:hypothetical protein